MQFILIFRKKNNVQLHATLNHTGLLTNFPHDNDDDIQETENSASHCLSTWCHSVKKPKF